MNRQKIRLSIAVLMVFLFPEIYLLFLAVPRPHGRSRGHNRRRRHRVRSAIRNLVVFRQSVVRLGLPRRSHPRTLQQSQQQELQRQKTKPDKILHLDAMDSIHRRDVRSSRRHKSSGPALSDVLRDFSVGCDISGNVRSHRRRYSSLCARRRQTCSLPHNLLDGSLRDNRNANQGCFRLPVASPRSR